jgi:hypothetical protein
MKSLWGSLYAFLFVIALARKLNSLECRGWQKSTVGRRKLVGLVDRLGGNCFVLYHYGLAGICLNVACTQYLLVMLSGIFITNGHQ